MNNDEFRLLIEQGDTAGLRRALELDSSLANRPVRWYLNQHNESDPLHYVSDCVGHGWLTGGRDRALAELLIAHGATLNGNDGRESPLIAAASLGAEHTADVLIKAGADLESTSVFGARALHWAAWTGMPSIVERLLAAGAAVDPRCLRFGATPLFWAVHGYGPDGPSPKQAQVEAARLLIRAGAAVHTSNNHGLSALDLARRCEKTDLYELLQQSSGLRDS